MSIGWNVRIVGIDDMNKKIIEIVKNEFPEAELEFYNFMPCMYRLIIKIPMPTFNFVEKYNYRDDDTEIISKVEKFINNCKDYLDNYGKPLR